MNQFIFLTCLLLIFCAVNYSAAGVAFSRNTNNQDAERTQNRNKYSNVEFDVSSDGTSRVNRDMVDTMLSYGKMYKVAKEMGYEALAGNDFEGQMIEESRSQRIKSPTSGRISIHPEASDQIIYQYGSLDNPYQNMRSAARLNREHH